MARQLYIVLLALHPARFRYRFGLEMLAIFDEASAQGGTLPLLVDGFRSLLCQWLRPYKPKAAAIPAGVGAPAFHSFEASPPAQQHIVTGVVSSLVLFAVLTIAIGSERLNPITPIQSLPSRHKVLRGNRTR